VNYLFLMKPPASFLQTMEDYVREAPRGSTFRKDQVRNCSLLTLFYRNKFLCALLLKTRKAKEYRISLTNSDAGSKKRSWKSKLKKPKLFEIMVFT